LELVGDELSQLVLAYFPNLCEPRGLIRKERQLMKISKSDLQKVKYSP
jgi:hypothetical protein